MTNPTPAAHAAAPLGRSGLKASRLWLGTMMFGLRTEADEAASIVELAREAGLNAVDTADMYAGGESERIVGRLIARDRERWVLATKVANPAGSDLPNDRGTSRRWIHRAVEASMTRLATDWIDLYYLHHDDPSVPLEETVSTMARLIDDGRVRYWGVSNFRGWRIAQIVTTADRLGVPRPIACQPLYNAMTREAEVEVLPCCAELGLGVVAYSPLARGVLTGKYAPGEAPPDGSRAARQDKRMMETEWRPESLHKAQALAAHAQRRGIPLGAFATAWVLHNRLVAGVLAGPRTLAQWQGYVDALAVTIGPEDEAAVDAQVPPGFASTHGHTDPKYPVTGRVPR